jgi:archaellum biogenesis ATPase FlaH
MDLEKQKAVLELLLSNPSLFAKCNPIIRPEYFDPLVKKSIAFAQDFFEKHHDLPSAQIIKGETKLEIVQYPLSKVEQDYVADEIESFCRTQALIDIVFKAPAMIEKGELGTLESKIKEAIQISLNRDLGINYFENVENRLRDLLNNSPIIPTFWKDVDDKLDGGPGRQELFLYAGGSNVGKSVTMTNHALNLIENGYNGIIITLEMSDRLVAKRTDSMITGIANREILDNISKVTHQVESFKSKERGELFIKRMPESTTTSNHIRAYLKEFQQTHAIRIDFIVVDYLDLMATNNRMSSDNVWLGDKFKAEELRGIGRDYDALIITASQLGRCLSIDTIVELLSGEKIKIIDVNIGDKIKSHDDYKTVLSKTEIDIQKIFQIVTSSGTKIKLTKNHVFPVYDMNGNFIYETNIQHGIDTSYYLNVEGQFEKIVDIFELNSEETIDIQVDGDELFFANGILVHNSAIEADQVHQGHIQGGFSKVQTADIMVALIQTDQMRAMGEFIFEFTKTRNSGGKGQNVLLRWNPISLRLTDLEETHELKNVPKIDNNPLANIPLNTGGTIFDKSNNSLLNIIKT